LQNIPEEQGDACEEAKGGCYVLTWAVIVDNIAGLMKNRNTSD
jgi:hypothetical protein